MEATITFPRKKHSHRCMCCGDAVYCYKSHCTKPQRIERCQWCKPLPAVRLSETTPGVPNDSVPHPGWRP